MVIEHLHLLLRFLSPIGAGLLTKTGMVWNSVNRARNETTKIILENRIYLSVISFRLIIGLSDFRSTNIKDASETVANTKNNGTYTDLVLSDICE
jgi:hypothetical protein